MGETPAHPTRRIFLRQGIPTRNPPHSKGPRVRVTAAWVDAVSRHCVELLTPCGAAQSLSDMRLVLPSWPGSLRRVPALVVVLVGCSSGPRTTNPPGDAGGARQVGVAGQPNGTAGVSSVDAGGVSGSAGTATAGMFGAAGRLGSGAAANGGSAGAPSTAAAGSSAPSRCAATQPTSCSAVQLRTTEIDVAESVVVNEDDAALKLLSIAPIPSGGSRLAWMSADSKLHVSTLDCDDQLQSSFTLPAHDYGDIYADDAGGVLLLTRDAMGGGTLNCGDPANLCGTPPNPPVPCYDMYMVRFDGTSETWATKLTTASASLPPYSTGPMGPQTYFIWWYAHHGRLAFDGNNWAAYYAAATSVSQACTSGGNTAINIHQGDEMRVVNASGMIVTGRGNGFDWGCSHSGFEKITWDPSSNKFVTICRSDGFPHAGLNVNASNLVFAISVTDSAVSNLVTAATAGAYWTLVSNAGALHLFRFTTGTGTMADVSLGSGTKPHLVAYAEHLFAAWQASGNTMTGQVLDRSTGQAIGPAVPLGVASNQFQDFRDYPDGSVAYPAPGSSRTKIKIVRVLPCLD